MILIRLLTGGVGLDDKSVGLTANSLLQSDTGREHFGDITPCARQIPHILRGRLWSAAQQSILPAQRRFRQLFGVRFDDPMAGRRGRHDLARDTRLTPSHDSSPI